MAIVAYLDCGCTMHDGGHRTLCPTCEAPRRPTGPIARITDEWLPFPTGVLEALEWREGDHIEILVTGGKAVLSKVKV
jgi:hypothetical protein